MKTLLQHAISERASLTKRLAALDQLIASYGEAETPAAPVNGAHPRAAEPKKRKERTPITATKIAEVLRLSALPEDERPTVPKIARQVGLSLTSVQRIRGRNQVSAS